MFKVTLSGTLDDGTGGVFELPWSFTTLEEANRTGDFMALGAPFHVTTITIKEYSDDRSNA